jgi:hypothetical protein
MTFQEAKVLLAQAHINITEGQLVIEAGSKIHKAMLRVAVHVCGEIN